MRPGNRPKTVCVVLAGGTGVRTGLEQTVDTVHGCAVIDEIIVMMEPHSLLRAEKLLPRSRYPKLVAVLPGGRTRNDTSFLALQQIDDRNAKVVFHDAVRPLVDAAIIGACLDALDTYTAVDTGLRRGQAPQAFRHSTLMKAYMLARKDPGFAAMDDCSVVHKYQPDAPILDLPLADRQLQLTLSLPGEVPFSTGPIHTTAFRLPLRAEKA